MWTSRDCPTSRSSADRDAHLVVAIQNARWVLEGDGGFGFQAGVRKRAAESWARLVRKILEVDPLLRPPCQVDKKIVSVITDTVVVDAILRHVDQGGGHDPHAPPAA